MTTDERVNLLLEQADIDRRLAARLSKLSLRAELSTLDHAACVSGAAALQYRADVYERKARRERKRRAQKLAALASRVGDDGTGDLGVILDTSPDASVDELVAIVRTAREEHALEAARAALAIVPLEAARSAAELER